MARHARRPTHRWITASGVILEIALPHLGDRLEPAFWWWPLQRANRSAQLVQCPPLHLDEFLLLCCIGRARSPELWIYLHRRTEAELIVDTTGKTYRLQPTRKDPTVGRFKACPVADAVGRAGLATVDEPYAGSYRQELGERRPAEEYGATISFPSLFTHGLHDAFGDHFRRADGLSRLRPLPPLLDLDQWVAAGMPERSPGDHLEGPACHEEGCRVCRPTIWTDADAREADERRWRAGFDEYGEQYLRHLPQPRPPDDEPGPPAPRQQPAWQPAHHPLPCNQDGPMPTPDLYRPRRHLHLVAPYSPYDGPAPSPN